MSLDEEPGKLGREPADLGQITTGRKGAAEFEKTLIQIAMSQTNGHRQEAAKLLGWGRNTLARKMKALHLD